MLPHKINDKNYFICGWYIDKEICNDLISFFDKGQPKIGEVFDKNGNLTVDKSNKDSLEIVLPEPRSSDISLKYIEALQMVLEEYKIKFPFCNNYGAYSILSPPQIQKYLPNGGFHKWHSERTSGGPIFVSSRHLVFMTYLNDVDDGGETEFYHQKLKVKPEKGLTLIWPADWTYTHRGIPSRSEEKYIITGWYNYH
jgi:hypothetical protein